MSIIFTFNDDCRSERGAGTHADARTASSAHDYPAVLAPFAIRLECRRGRHERTLGRVAAWLLSAATVFAAGSLDAPRKGCVFEAGVGVRMVYGLRSNFVLSEPVFDSALAAVCSDRVVAVRMDTALVLTDSRGSILAAAETGGGAAVLGFGDSGVFAWLAESREMWRSHNAEWERIPFPVDGAVIAVSNYNRDTAALVRRDDGVWLVRMRDGATTHQERIAGSASVAYLWPDGAMLLAEDATLRSRDPGGVEQVLQLPSIVRSLNGMNVSTHGGWVQVEMDGIRVALERERDKIRMALLPGGAR